MIEITIDEKSVYANKKQVGHYWSGSESSSGKPRIRIFNENDEMIFIEPGISSDGYYEFDNHEIINAIQELKISVPTK